MEKRDAVPNWNGGASGSGQNLPPQLPRLTFAVLLPLVFFLLFLQPWDSVPFQSRLCRSPGPLWHHHWLVEQGVLASPVPQAGVARLKKAQLISGSSSSMGPGA